MKVTTWTKRECYSDSWNGLIVPEAYSHPAKFAPGLIRKILQHGFEQGWWVKGSVIGDCFGGIGGGGIMAASMGLKWVGCELESRFVDLASQNFALHARKWDALGCPQPVMIQGDSRNFAELVGEVEVICTSPPFADSLGTNDVDFENARQESRGRNINGFGHKGSMEQWPVTPGQIGAMKPGNLAAVVTSPPYAETRFDGGEESLKKPQGFSRGYSKDGGYSSNPANIGNLKAGRLDAITTSPPYEGIATSGGTRGLKEHGTGLTGAVPCFGEYGISEGQIGTTTSTTYWEACAAVYRSCHQALRPGGIFCLVVKSYIKAKRRVPLPMQTLKLLINLGFQPVERIKALLVEETVTPGLFGDVTRKSQRKSFFRLLAERKGSPEINFEEVIVVRKP
jgi:tRNA G10  N-methylase Trm11